MFLFLVFLLLSVKADTFPFSRQPSLIYAALLHFWSYFLHIIQTGNSGSGQLVSTLLINVFYMETGQRKVLMGHMEQGALWIPGVIGR